MLRLASPNSLLYDAALLRRVRVGREQNDKQQTTGGQAEKTMRVLHEWQPKYAWIKSC